MFQSLDHIVLAVADLETATAEYRTVFGRAPSWRGNHPDYGTRNTLFRLDNTYVELLAADRGAHTPFSDMVRDALGDRNERPLGLALGVDDINAAVNILRGRGLRVANPSDGMGVDERSGRRRTWRNALMDPTTAGGMRLLLIQHTSPPKLLPRALPIADDASVCLGVDHVVIFSSDLNATLRLWSDTFRIPEQWRRDFPERGTRNVGLLLGDITIEIIMRTDQVPGTIADRLWGVAYQVFDVDRAVARLRAANLEVDDPRPGLAEGTRVATLRRKGTATLLLARDATRPSSG
ncbi:MAG: VOC family protein [Deltaproteobacteria bacterium]|nr:VOC family protein [Deltaproteobacteria bacterium]MBI3388439.1 VOC family protein [Deltaproteobacteria bacterium]